MKNVDPNITIFFFCQSKMVHGSIHNDIKQRKMANLHIVEAGTRKCLEVLPDSFDYRSSEFSVGPQMD